jgi:hypothetical protein
MRQRPGVFEHLAEVAHVDPAVAGRALNEMLGFVRGRLAETLADDLASSDVHSADIGQRQSRGQTGIFVKLNQSGSRRKDCCPKLVLRDVLHHA